MTNFEDDLLMLERLRIDQETYVDWCSGTEATWTERCPRYATQIIAIRTLSWRILHWPRYVSTGVNSTRRSMTYSWRTQRLPNWRPIRS